MEKTHIATTCKIEKVTTPSEDNLLICIPVEVVEGTIGAKKKFVDTEGNEFLPAYEAYLKGEKVGYFLDISFNEILGRGKEYLSQSLGYQYDIDGKEEQTLIILNYKEEYVAELEDLTWYFDLGELLGSVLSRNDNEDFYEMYQISIDRNFGCITTKPPKKLLTGKAYADFKSEFSLDKEKDLESDSKTDPVSTDEAKTKITRIGLIEDTKKYVIAQDNAVSLVASAIYNPIALNAPKLRQNILLYGPTGVGKTYILETIARKLDIPYYYSSIGDFSATGYVGSSVNDLYTGLYNAAGKSKEKLEKGAILFLDEVDKLILGDSTSSDVKGQVYNELLPLYQHGGTVTFKVGDHGPTIKYNKERLQIVSGGSFARMDKQNRQKMGFTEAVPTTARKKYYTKKDFEKFGVPVEWLGRQDLCIPLEALSEDDLYRILTESLESVYLTTVEVLKLRGITLVIPDNVLRKIAHKAYTLQTGARSLRGVFEFAVQKEINNIVDSIDNDNIGEKTYEINEEAVVKRLGEYFG